MTKKTNICILNYFHPENKMNITTLYLREAVYAGILAIVFGWIASFIVRPFFKVSLPEICKEWNKKRVMEVSLFVAGFLGWLTVRCTNVVRIQ